MDARSLDVRADDLPADHVTRDDVLYALRVHSIVQSGRTSGTGESGQAAPKLRRRLLGEDLSHQNIGPLCTSSETTLPDQLGVLLRTVCLQNGSERVVKCGGSMAVTTFGAATDHDLETTRQGLLSVTGMGRHVNQRSGACHDPRDRPSRPRPDEQEGRPTCAADGGRYRAVRPRLPAAYERVAMARNNSQTTRVVPIVAPTSSPTFNNLAVSATTSAWIQPSCRSFPVRAAARVRRSKICERRAAEPVGSSRQSRRLVCSI